LPPPPQLLLNQHRLRAFLPFTPPESLFSKRRLIQRPLLLPNDQAPRISDCFVQLRSLLLVEKQLMRFCQAVEGVGGERIACFVRMDQEGFLAVDFYYIAVGETGLDV